MRFRNALAAIGCLIALGAGAAAEARTVPSEPLARAGQISFCTELGQPPANYIGSDGVTPEGLEVDIMKAIGAELGLETKITNYKLAGILAALDSNKCDALMSSMVVTPERREKYGFVEYMFGASGLLVPAGNPLNLHVYEDLSGRRVAVLLGSANERLLNEASATVVAAGRPPIKLVGYSTNAVAFKELEYGRVDAFAAGSLTLAYWMSRAGGEFEIGGMPIPPYPLGIMLPKDEGAKRESIRQAYATLVADGTIEKIVAKWGVAKRVSLCDGVCGPAAEAEAVKRLASASRRSDTQTSQPGKSHIQFDVGFFLAFVFNPPATLLKGLGLTIFAAACSLVLGANLGALLAIGGISRFRTLRIFNQTFIAFFRGTPVLVQLVLIYFGIPALLGGIDLFPASMSVAGIKFNGALVAGIVTFSLHEAAYLSEIFRAGIQSIDRGQTEAAKSLGMSPGLTMRRIVLPQAMRVIIPPLGNQFNIVLKTTSLLSVIAVPEMFHVADSIQSVSFKTFEVYLGISVYYLALTGISTLLQRQLERRIDRDGQQAVAARPRASATSSEK